MEFSASGSIKAGWRIFKERPWFLVGVMLLSALAGFGIGEISSLFGTSGILGVLGALVNFLLNTLLGLCITAFMLKAHDSIRDAAIVDLWHPRPFFSYLGATVLNGIIVVVGLIVLVIPGIIFGIMLLFTPYLVVDRDLTPIKALKESARITKGNRWQLFMLLILMLLINILGIIALLVGLLVTIPVTSLAIVHAYRALSKNAAL
ncbi:MAG: hypothetical protein RLZZ416_24 [Candidatus Parcubacteria bacterium]|jgi:uncharacterized membrane protein